ncbi:hypothetical protein D1AOALGA4SA_12394 [Olavius algarvensis Delta 1 endosymbiont]|nr:hypothetical protein D1AOALGA4SA_12394 [Olavius algarvensis Delta 1 endosymbiont]
MRHLNFGISDLFRISYFEFHISGLSGLGFPKTDRNTAKGG